MTSAQVVKTSVNVPSNSPSQDYTHPDDRNLPNYDSLRLSVLVTDVVNVVLFLYPQGRWFYALLVCLEKPLLPETTSLLRTLARLCATLRATLVCFCHFVFLKEPRFL